MKKPSNKQRLFEVMSRLDKTFKPKLNENLNNELIEYEVPSWALSALINDDYSGLEDEDEAKLNQFTQEVVNAHGNAHFILDDIEGKDNLGFRHSNDVDNLGSDVYRVYIRPDKESSTKELPFNKKLRGGEHYMSENTSNSKLNEPIIPDAINIISNNPNAVKFNNKQEFLTFLDNQKYFSASYSHCFYSIDDYKAFKTGDRRWRDDNRADKKCVMLFETGRELVAVWDEINKIGYIIPSRRQ